MTLRSATAPRTKRLGKFERSQFAWVCLLAVLFCGCADSGNPSGKDPPLPMGPPLSEERPGVLSEDKSDSDKLLAENQQLSELEGKHALAGEYGDAIEISAQRESVLLEMVKLAEFKQMAIKDRIEALEGRMAWQLLSGSILDAVKTSEQRRQIAEQEFGTKHWQFTNAHFDCEYCGKLAELDEPTRTRMLDLVLQSITANAKGDFREAIAKVDALKKIEAKVLGVEHPYYANSLATLADNYFKVHEYDRAVETWRAALTIRRKAFGDEHPEVIACHDGLAAVARQRGNWAEALAQYNLAAPLRRKLFGTLSPDDPAVCLDDFAQDSRNQYEINGDVAWEPGKLTLTPGASVACTVAADAFWQMTLDFTVPSATGRAQSSEVRFEFILEEDDTRYAVVWQPEPFAAKYVTKVRLEMMKLQRSSDAKQIARENVTTVRQTTIDGLPNGHWKLNWASGLLRVEHAGKLVLLCYAESDRSLKRWQVRAISSGTSILTSQFLGAAVSPLDDAATARLIEAQRLNNEVFRLNRAGRFADAAKLAQSVLEIRRTLLGEDHPATVASLNNLAWQYELPGNYADAEPLYQRALKISEKMFGPDHPLNAMSLNNLALLYKSQGNYAGAEPLYRRAMQIHENIFGPDHPNTATGLNNLAKLYAAEANFAAAEPLSLRALKINEKALGPDHPSTAKSIQNLAQLYYAQANDLAAEELYLRALKINEKVLGPDHPNTAASLINLAAIYRAQGNFAAAEPLSERAMKINEKTLGPDHPDTAMTLNNLAELYREQMKYAAAEPLYLQALKIREMVLGSDHPDTATSLNNLALLYESQGNNAAAEPLYQRAIEISEKALGPDHPDTAMTLINLAKFQWQRGELEAAAPLAKRALDIKLRHADATAAIQTEQQQFLMSHDVGNNVGFWLTVSGADAKLTSTVYRDVLAWKGLITARQQGQRRVLKDDPLFDEFRRVTQQLSTVSLSPPLPPSDPKAIDAWKTRAPELRRNWESQKAKLEALHERLEKLLAAKSATFRESLEQRRMKPDDLITLLKEQDRPNAFVDVLEYDYFDFNDMQKKWRIVAFVVRGDRPIARVELGSAFAITRQVSQWRKGFGRKSNDQNPGEELRKSVWLPLETHLEGIEVVLVSPDGAVAQLPWGALPGAKPGSYLLEERAIAVIPVPQMLPALLSKERREGLPQSLLLAGDIDYGGDPGAVSPSDKRDAVGRLRDGKLFEFTRLPAGPAEMGGIEKRYQPKPEAHAADMLRGSAATEAAFCEQARQHAWLHLITHGYFAPETVRSALAPDPDEAKSVRFQFHIDRPRVVKGEHPGLLSGLAFAGANTPPAPGHDDGILTALEVSSLDLSNVDAVVLSACETGLGEVAGGEGLLGLQRAFQVAGAKSVVASLWKVPDAETSLLMQLFYENVWEKELPRLEALRQAQLHLLHNYDPKSHTLRGTVGKLKPVTEPTAADRSDPKNKETTRCPPFYWAAFVLSGDWR